MDLVELSDTPQHHPDCCLALSNGLLSSLIDALPSQPQSTFSIGSGSGLLEALINLSAPKLVYGVEVNQSINKYLSQEMIHFVPGTHALLWRASEASAWMFVYPREIKLVKLYLETIGSKIEKIIWLGPRVDWPDYESVFMEFGSISIVASEVCGLPTYEVMVLVNRRMP
jgi:hypothetical protein